MLQWIRNIGKSRTGKIATALLFGAIIVSFGFIGISGVFRGAMPTTVVSIGETEISRTVLQRTVENFMTQMARDKTPITRTQLKAQGYDQIILNGMVQEALLDELALQLKLGAPLQTIQQYIVNQAIFQKDGEFDNLRFATYMSATGMNEALYITQLQSTIPKQQILSALQDDLFIPDTKTALSWRLAQEKRAIQSIVINFDEKALPTIDDEGLKAFFEPRKKFYIAPEQRDVAVLVIDPKTLEKNITISEKELRDEYDRSREALKTTGKRTVEQLIFGSPDQAEAAAMRINEGIAFETIIEELNGKDGVSFIPASSPIAFEMLAGMDPSLAKAIFEQDINKPSTVIQSDLLGSVIIRVTGIQVPEPQPFEEVETELKQKLIGPKVQKELQAFESKIEDLRGEQKPILEIAKELNLPVHELKAIDAQGRTSDGNNLAQNLVTLVPNFLTLTFQTGINEDAGMLQTSEGGYMWFDVTNITPHHEKSFEDVSDALTQEWRNETLARQAEEKAKVLLERINQGETLQAIAHELGTEVKSTQDISRSQTTLELTSEGVSQVFATHVGKLNTTKTDNGILLFKVMAAEMPPFDPTDIDALLKKLELTSQQKQDIYSDLLGQLRKDIPIKINQALYNQVFGDEREN